MSNVVALAKKPKFMIVLKYLMQAQGEVTIAPFKNSLSGMKFGMHNNKFCHIMYSETEEMWCHNDISFNGFVDMCEELTDQEITSLIFDSAMREMRKKR